MELTMTVSHVPIYLDWTFWAVVMSATAILLSQLPPMRLWFRRAKVDVEPYSMIHISHKIGNPNLQLHLILSNLGGRDALIKGITLSLTRDGQPVASLPAVSYLETPNDKA